jgi:hypothetical protein
VTRRAKRAPEPATFVPPFDPTARENFDRGFGTRQGVAMLAMLYARKHDLRPHSARAAELTRRWLAEHPEHDHDRP